MTTTAWSATPASHRSLRGVRELKAPDPKLDTLDESDFALGFALQQQGKTDEAIVVYRRFLEAHPDHAQDQSLR
jgi:hypothetical protein